MLPKLNNHNGAVALEFVLLLPFLLLLIFGIIEFSFLLFDKAMITNASREGARAGVVYNYPSRILKSKIEQISLNYCKNHLISFGSSASPPNVDIFPADDDPPCPEEASSGSSIRVSVDYDYNFLFLSSILPPISLKAESNMRCE